MIKQSTKPRQELEGQKIGRWSVGKYLGQGYYDGACECGAKRHVLARSLLNGDSRSCGCLSNELRQAQKSQEKERKKPFVPQPKYE